MSGLVELTVDGATGADGRLLLNPQQVVRARSNRQGQQARLYLTDGTDVLVQESYDHVAELLARVLGPVLTPAMLERF